MIASPVPDVYECLGIDPLGAIGILTGGLTAAAAGITTSLVCGVVCSLVGRSHDQN